LFLKGGSDRMEKERAAEKEVVELGFPSMAALNTTLTNRR